MSYSLTDASSLLGVTADKILRLVEAGKVHPMIVNGCDYFFSAEDLTTLGSLLGSTRTRGPNPQTVQVDPSAEVFTVKQLAAMWNLSEDVIRAEFENEPDVLKLARARKGKRPYKTIRIPKDVAERVRRRMSS